MRTVVAEPPPVREKSAASKGGRSHDWLPHFKMDLWICLALLAVTFAVYAQVRNFDFVNFDDPEYVANPHVRTGITPDGIAWAFTSRDAANWFPVTRLSHELDCQLFGLSSGWHHLTNVLLHGGAVVLLFAFLLAATRARWPSAFVAFVFALHPLHVESVAWVAERKDVLCAFFWFLALWLYVRYAERPELKRYLLVILAFVLGMLAKPMIVTLPVVLLIVDYWPLQRLQFTKRTVLSLVREKIPFFVLAAALAVGTFIVQQASGAVRTESVFPIALRIENALVSYIIYIGQMFWPARLAVFYPYPREFPIWEPAFAALLLAAITVGAVFAKRTHPYLIAGWLWYLITLLPVIGLVQVGSQAHADRYMYIPMVGLLVMVAWGAATVLSRRTAEVAAVAACSCCAVVTFIQLGNWRNSETLYRHAIAVTHGNYLAEHNWGTYLMNRSGRLTEAIDHLETAVRLKPDSMEAHTDLGSALAKVPGRRSEAIAQYRTALRIQPRSAITLNDLGNALSTMPGRLPEAIEDYKAALRIQPDYADAHNDLGSALAKLPGRLPDAIAEYKAALPSEPDSAQIHYNLALALSETGRLQEAISEYETAIHLKPDYAEAHDSLGTVLAHLGRLPEAIAEYQAALPFEANSPEVHYNLGLALAKSGRAAEAMEQFETVLRLTPDSAEAHNNLGVLLSQSGRAPEAIRHFEAAVRKNPNYAEAQYNLGMALAQTGRPREGLEHFEAAERIKPDADTEQILTRLRAAMQ